MHNLRDNRSKSTSNKKQPLLYLTADVETETAIAKRQVKYDEQVKSSAHKTQIQIHNYTSNMQVNTHHTNNDRITETLRNQLEITENRRQTNGL